MSGALTFDNVTCARAGRVLFADLSLVLEPGQAIIVSGENGAGKSSLLRIAAGLLRPAQGRVEATGKRALLAEAAALDDERNVAEILNFWAKLDGTNRVGEVLEELALDHLAEVPVRLLSTGQRRRVAFARVVASDAPIWLLDEPANGVDRAATARLEAAIARHRAAGGGVMAATHQPLALDGATEVRL